MAEFITASGMRRGLTLPCLVLLLTSWSCTRSEDPPDSDRIDVRSGGPNAGGVIQADSAGVRIVTSLHPRWGEPGSRPWTLEPATGFLGLREADSTIATEFHLISDVAVLAGGGVAVADRLAAEISLFDSTGVFIRSFGRRGGGPGELWVVGSIHTCLADSLFLGARGDLNVFTTDGEFVRRQRMESGGRLVSLQAVAPSCDRYLVRLSTAYPRRGATGFGRATFAWSNPSFDSLTPLESPLIMSHVRVVSGRDGAMPRPLPWTGTGRNWGIFGNEVIAGFGDAARLSVFRADGDLVREVRWSSDPQPVRGPDRDLYMLRRRQFMDEYGPNDESRAIYPGLGELESVPETKAIFDGLVVDDRGNVWVRHYPPTTVGATDAFFRVPPEVDAERWTVIDSTGVWLGALSMPDGFALHSVAFDHLFGVQRDSLLVERAARIRLRR